MGFWQWLFGKGSNPPSEQPVVRQPQEQQPTAAPPVPSLSPAERAAQIQSASTTFVPVTGAAVGGVSATPEKVIGTVGGITLKASVQVREMTPEEIADAHGWFSKAFDWAMQEVTISEVDRQKLFGFLRGHWNSSRIDMRALDALGIAFSWPRAEVYLRDRQGEEHEENVADLDAMDNEEALRCLKAPELKALMQAHGLSAKGRATKTVMIEALLGLDGDTRRAIRDELVARFKRELPDPAVAAQRELVVLLHRRVIRAAQRMRRAVQVYDMHDGGGIYNYTHIRVDAFMADGGRAPCGLKHGEIRPAATLIDRVKEPLCESIECCCSFSPHSPELHARRGR